MTPKEKADDLINKYLTSRDDNQWDDVRDVHAAIRCALIAVDEVIEFMEADDFDSDTCYWANHSQMKYWTEVKQEIEKL
jgi:hypothetical protein